MGQRGVSTVLANAVIESLWQTLPDRDRPWKKKTSAISELAARMPELYKPSSAPTIRLVDRLQVVSGGYDEAAGPDWNPVTSFNA